MEMILDIILIVLDIFILTLLAMSHFGKKVEAEKKFVEDMDFIEDILNYCMQKELKVSIMENTKGNLALYEMLDDGSTVSILELFVSANKKGTPEYLEMLKEATYQIDAFIENKDLLLNKK